MGIDSWQLLDKVLHMDKLPMMIHYGETGTLQMNRDNVISRSLSWGKYRASRVQSIDME